MPFKPLNPLKPLKQVKQVKLNKIIKEMNSTTMNNFFKMSNTRQNLNLMPNNHSNTILEPSLEENIIISKKQRNSIKENTNNKEEEEYSLHSKFNTTSNEREVFCNLLDKTTQKLIGGKHDELKKADVLWRKIDPVLYNTKQKVVINPSSFFSLDEFVERNSKNKDSTKFNKSFIPSNTKLENEKSNQKNLKLKVLESYNTTLKTNIKLKARNTISSEAKTENISESFSHFTKYNTTNKPSQIHNTLKNLQSPTKINERISNLNETNILKLNLKKINKLQANYLRDYSQFKKTGSFTNHSFFNGKGERANEVINLNSNSNFLVNKEEKDGKEGKERFYDRQYNRLIRNSSLLLNKNKLRFKIQE